AEPVPEPEPAVEAVPADPPVEASSPVDDAWRPPEPEPAPAEPATPSAAELWPEERLPASIEEVVPFEPVPEDEGVQTFEVLPDDAPAAGGTPVDALEGVGPLYATRLREAGLSNVEDFLGRDAWQVANATGISIKLLEQWGVVARFVTLGASVAHAEALARVGLASTADLAAADAGDLVTRLNAHLGAAGRLGEVPAVTDFDVRRWQAAARS
ncbi:MAG TPA: helix-hairpin-helix domain-containing protein, partial [Candidatus Thermoplasmatota archaeon]|nr:helix-hairpin-helix domain-containing protein [Candidatus Thermoplasmatota archaeon]